MQLCSAQLLQSAVSVVEPKVRGGRTAGPTSSAAPLSAPACLAVTPPGCLRGRHLLLQGCVHRIPGRLRGDGLGPGLDALGILSLTIKRSKMRCTGQ